MSRSKLAPLEDDGPMPPLSKHARAQVAARFGFGYPRDQDRFMRWQWSMRWGRIKRRKHDGVVKYRAPDCVFVVNTEHTRVVTVIAEATYQREAPGE